MKKLLLSITALVLTTGLFAQDAEKPAGKKAADVAKFESETIDLGKIFQNNPTTATFEVTNIGKEPLLIEQASPTCGCTISDYTKEPIAPGKKGIIKATYNAKNMNMFEKHLKVKFAGVDEDKIITLKGEVVANPEAETKAAAAPAESKMEMENQAKVEDAKKAVEIKKTAVKAAPAKKTEKVKKP